MEKRIAKVNVSSAGGTASKNSKTHKITLPGSWLAILGINENNRELELEFDGRQIILSRSTSGEEFAVRGLEQKHDVRLFLLYDCNVLCTTIYADFTVKRIVAENHLNDHIKTAFGNNTLPSWDDFQIFLQERCIPKERAGLREYMEAIDVSEYDPVEIIRKTAGRMAEDNQWLEIVKL